MEGKVGLEPELGGSSKSLTAPDWTWTEMWVSDLQQNSGAHWEAAHHRKVALPESATRGQSVQGRPGSPSQPGGISWLLGPAAFSAAGWSHRDGSHRE